MTRLSIPPLKRVSRRREAEVSLQTSGEEWLTRATRLLATALRENQAIEQADIPAKIVEIAQAGYEEALCRRPTAPALCGAAIYARNLRAWGEDLADASTRERFLAIVRATLK